MNATKGPRSKRKRAARAARLKSAREWLPSAKAKDVVKGYAKRFGVDLGCALRELQMLRVPLDPAYVERLRRRLENRKNRRRSATISDIPEGYGLDWDENFSFIAGFTSGGAPYGVTWEQSLSSEAVDVASDIHDFDTAAMDETFDVESFEADDG